MLIHQDANAADRYLQKLSEIYRYILRNKSNELIPLAEELDFLNKYIELLTIRFEESLKFSIDVKNAGFQKLIPPAVLQLLVENVVKHNYLLEKNPSKFSFLQTKPTFKFIIKKTAQRGSRILIWHRSSKHIR